jgi:hypothetical protein
VFPSGNVIFQASAAFLGVYSLRRFFIRQCDAKATDSGGHADAHAGMTKPKPRKNRNRIRTAAKAMA